MAGSRTVALVTLGCARNEVDSEELAGRLEAGGWTLVEDAADADVAVVNTCGFVEQAKKDSIDTLLEASELKAAGRTRAVVAVGCLAERYGAQLAAELPEADAVLGFDTYADLSAHLDAILGGGRPPSHVPVDRRTLLPLSPVDRQAVAFQPVDLQAVRPRAPGFPAGGGSGPGERSAGRPAAARRAAVGTAEDRVRVRPAVRVLRDPVVPRGVRLPAPGRRAGRGPVAGRPGDPRAVPGERELHVLRQGPGRPAAAGEAAAGAGRRRRRRRACASPTCSRPRCGPGCSTRCAAPPGVAPYFDLSFQHASGPLLRRMRRFGDRESFLTLLDQVRERAPLAGVRSNVIVGFPGRDRGRTWTS